MSAEPPRSVSLAPTEEYNSWYLNTPVGVQEFNQDPTRLRRRIATIAADQNNQKKIYFYPKLMQDFPWMVVDFHGQHRTCIKCYKLVEDDEDYKIPRGGHTYHKVKSTDGITLRGLQIHDVCDMHKDAVKHWTDQEYEPL